MGLFFGNGDIATLSELGREAYLTVVNTHREYLDCFPELRNRILLSKGNDALLSDEWGAIQAILALDMAYYVVHRLPYVCGSISDSLLATRRQLIDEYKLIYGPYNNPNDKVTF